MDVRPGGRERLKGRWEGGMVSTFDAIYHDVIRERAAGLQLRDAPRRQEDLGLAGDDAAEGGRREDHLKVTEQGAFLDGYDDAGSREQGTGHLLDALGASLQD